MAAEENPEFASVEYAVDTRDKDINKLVKGLKNRSKAWMKDDTTKAYVKNLVKDEKELTESNSSWKNAK